MPGLRPLTVPSRRVSEAIDEAGLVSAQRSNHRSNGASARARLPTRRLESLQHEGT